jgi:hypothetical protein
VVDGRVAVDQRFPTVRSEAWGPQHREDRDLFGAGNARRHHAGCYLIGSRGRTLLVDTGVGPSSPGLATALEVGGEIGDVDRPSVDNRSARDAVTVDRQPARLAQRHVPFDRRPLKRAVPGNGHQRPVLNAHEQRVGRAAQARGALGHGFENGS